MKSSDWCANEKECSDSDGKRERSSVKLGEAGPEDRPEGIIETIDDDLGMPAEGLREDAAEEGKVGVRMGWC